MTRRLAAAASAALLLLVVACGRDEPAGTPDAGPEPTAADNTAGTPDAPAPTASGTPLGQQLTEIVQACDVVDAAAFAGLVDGEPVAAAQGDGCAFTADGVPVAIAAVSRSADAAAALHLAASQGGTPVGGGGTAWTREAAGTRILTVAKGSDTVVLTFVGDAIAESELPRLAEQIAGG